MQDHATAMPGGPKAAQGSSYSVPAGLATLSLRGLRDAVLAGDPGCVCDPELFTGPAGIEPEDEPPQDRAARDAMPRGRFARRARYAGRAWPTRCGPARRPGCGPGSPRRRSPA